ncbi:MAG: Ig family protein [Bacteroidetes bacterium]|jgi:hypothetical protein|nr:Ig family protein [Bacteroidota bacterium]
MKRKITLLLMIATCVFKMNSQVLFSENFTAPFAGTGWAVQNNSSPTSTLTWFQGSTTTFTAYNGAAADYIACNYQSIASGAGTISNWLITPTLNLTNGNVLMFASRTVTASTVYPDRLEVRMSTAGTSTNVGATATSVGDFSTTLVTINPSLTTTGYPTTWTIYTATLSGITGTVQGRFAFRYFVTNGGPTGANSDYIGVDAVQYSAPCSQPTIAVSSSSAGICSGTSVTLTASGATTYTWTNGGVQSSTIAVTPSVTTTYTVSGTSAGCVGTMTSVVTVTATPNLAIPSVTTCASTASTLQAGPASTYSWNTGATTSSIVVSPASTTNYTVWASNGACMSSQVVTVTIGSNLSINVTGPTATVCGGTSQTLTASGAQSYTWVNTGSNASAIIVNPASTTIYTVAGQSGACFGANTVAVNVTPSPTVVATTNNSLACVNQTVILSASGASTYTWTQFGVASSSIALGTGTASGVYNIIVAGTSAGCTSTAAVTQSVSACVDINTNTIANNNVSVFPNPFTTEVKISGVTGNVQIFNTLGQMVISTSVNENETINTSNLAKGVYIVKAFDSEGREVKTIRIIKN